MALMGAEVLFYPTAIGSEPHDPSLDTAGPWRRAMQGHAVSNVIPVVGANRTGFEPWDGYPNGGQLFYGSSFIADHRGELTAAFDLPPGPALEVGWRFAPAAWGGGYATEAGRAAIAWAFANRPESEIIAITARTNLRSQAVMKRLGMVYDPSRDFDHPRVPDDSPLKAHVTFSLRRP
jgi:RimJ/RimL family protein N-acetyltransferase